jgi:hypothetical protein
MNLRPLALGTAVAAAALAVSALSVPAGLAAFTMTGEFLPLTQRDMRVFNNFSDPSANDNLVPHPNFPGQVGAPLAIWKAHVEWASEPYAGNGKGDPLPSNPVLGGCGANFDNTFQRLASSPGTTNDNVHSEILDTSGSTLAFTETPITDGWRTRYGSSWNWSDGPGLADNGQIDLQAIATHEVGHTLGLGHSSVFGVTMAPAVSGSGEGARSVEADDCAGVQAIYGVLAPSKPHIEALSGSKSTGGALVITGANFAPTGNEAWFTRDASDGEPVKVLGLVGLLGGTRLELAIPAGVADGEVLVKAGSSTSGSALSNAFPIGIVDAPPLAGAFTPLEPGLGPVGGAEPWLGGAGDLSPGTGDFLLLLEDVPAHASGLLFVSLQEGAASLKGGTLYAVPIAALFPIAVDGSGSLQITATLPAGTPPATVIVVQAWFADASGPQGALASNGLRLDTP